MTAAQLAKLITNTSQAAIASQLTQMTRKGFLTRVQTFNPTSGKQPWNYTITPKGRKYLSLRLQLKALLHERE